MIDSFQVKCRPIDPVLLEEGSNTDPNIYFKHPLKFGQ